MIDIDDLETWMKELAMIIMQSQDNSEDETFFFEWWEDMMPFIGIHVSE